ncbi:MAG TPA: DNA-formamidopyrimidine glycosylase family protein [Terriglobales bacterium]|nr:DNA-formamidopyrimidine glycosylase family protein [Terriglobales bacterium]
MPEGDTIFRAARTLNKALAGKVVTRFETVLPHLERVHVDAPVTGRVVESVTSHGKWITMQFSGDLILLTHMLMSGSWHIYRPGERWHRRHDDMRIVIATESIEAIAFNVPIAEFHTTASLARRPGFNRLGQDVLAAEFDEQVASQQLRSAPDLEVGEALLRQSLLAGIGNVFKSEIAFACGVNPFRTVATLKPEEATWLVRTARKYLLANVSDTSNDKIVTYTGFRRTTGRANEEERLWVYGRAGQPCRKCGTPVRRLKQGPDARVTFWCPSCQR